MTPAPRPLRIGTRASALAQWQAEHVADGLSSIPGAPSPELVLIRTEGDRVLDVPLSKLQGKAFFTKEIEEALLSKRVDVAVHSLKDLPTTSPPGLRLAAVMEREDPRDVLLSAKEASLEALEAGSRVGTSSLRRRALLAHSRPDLTLLELRGNVPTRIGKLDAGEYDAIVLAAAGVIRLGMAARISSFLPVETFLPAVSQGAIGVQIRDDDPEVGGRIEALDHAPTRISTTAERAFLRHLEGGCQVPVGAHAQVNEGRLYISGVICSLDGTQAVTGSLSGPAQDPDALGTALARELESRGGEAILRSIREGTGGG